ncbi:hypothetical protein ACFXAF_00495 [Kitasatospora sp. NPDC059463]|uniref:hypothetical protein n=1 Tax=unclassified Kitasatospora TaxID=2633591 RepID=UPI003684C04D
MNDTVIYDPLILKYLPEGTEIEDADGDTGTKIGDGFAVAGWRHPLDADWFTMPATVIDPAPETVELVADLSSGRELHPVLKELRSIAAAMRDRLRQQEDELGALTDGYGDVPVRNLARWDELQADHREADSAALLETLIRLETITSPRSGP